MKKNLVDRKPFTPDSLPKNRFVLFWDIAFHQWRTLLTVSLLMALFALPFFAVHFLFQTLISTAAGNGVDASGIFALTFYWGLSSIPAMTILHLGLPGAFEVGKSLSFQEGVIPGATFFQGLKEQWKKALVLGLVSGILLFGLLLGGMAFWLVHESSPILSGIGIGALVLLFLTVEIAFFFTYSQMSVYQNTLLAHLRNGFLFSLIRLPLNAVYFLLFPGSVLILLLVHPIASYVAFGAYVLFASFGVLIWNIYSNGLFDKFINATYYPDLVGKGMAPKGAKED